MSTETGSHWWYNGDGSEGFSVCVEWLHRLYVVSGILHGPCQLTRHTAFYLTAHFSSHDFPYEWLMHWLSKVCRI